MKNYLEIIDEAIKIGMAQIPSESERLLDFVSYQNFRNILEIGSLKGGNFYLLCKGSSLEGKKISLDYEPNYSSIEERNKLFVTWAKNVYPLIGDSHDSETFARIEEILDGEKLDFLFIDGDHSYEGVKKDFEIYKNLVKENGYIGFHDINQSEFTDQILCFVSKFWDELEGEKIEFNIGADKCGIGIIKNKKINYKTSIKIDPTTFKNNKINISYNSKDPFNGKITIRDIDSEIPIYTTNEIKLNDNDSFYIEPIGNYDFEKDIFCNGFLIDFYSNNNRLLFREEMRIKNKKNENVIKFPNYFNDDCLYINYRELFYERRYDNLIDKSLDTVIDLGANVGFFTYYSLMLGAKRIISVEPNPKSFNFLKKLSDSNNQIEVLQKAIDVKNAKRDLFYSDNNSTISSFTESLEINQQMVVETITLQQLFLERNIKNVSLLKMDVEGGEYDILSSSNDNLLTNVDQFIIEFHKNDGKLIDLIKRFERLGFSSEIRNQATFQIEKNLNLANGTLIVKKTKFPEECFITFVTKNYLDIVQYLIKSIKEFSNKKIIVYSINCDIEYSYDNLIKQRLDFDYIEIPKFIEDKEVQVQDNKVKVPDDNLGCVDRNDLKTYKLLTLKPQMMLHAIQNGVKRGVFLDADGMVRENIENIFNNFKNAEKYPLIGKGLFEFMLLNGKGSVPDGDKPLEFPLMEKLNVYERTMPYVSTNVILFTNEMKDFLKEWVDLSYDDDINNNNVLYAPYHDETLVNTLLWKYRCTKQLPVSHFNAVDFNCVREFYAEEKSNLRMNINYSEWQYIPKEKDSVFLLHGCKSMKELERIFSFLQNHFGKNHKNININPLFRLSKVTTSEIAIVTLFDDAYFESAMFSIKNKQDYALKHNYDFIFYSNSLGTKRPPQWSKILAVKENLNKYKWIWWIDIDSLIMNFETKLENIIDNNYDMIFTENKYSCISNGSSFYKNCDLTNSFLQETYDLKRDELKNINPQVFDHEQQAMRELLKDEKYKSKTLLIDERICNSFWYCNNPEVLDCYPDWNKENNIYREGDFIIQFCGNNIEAKNKLIKEFYKKIK